MSVDVFDRSEVARVEFLVEILFAFVGDSIESSMDLIQETVFRQFAASSTGVLPHRASFCFDGGRGEIPIFSNKFEYTVIRRDHPVRLFSHYVRQWRFSTHRITDEMYMATYILQSIERRNLALNNRQ